MTTINRPEVAFDAAAHAYKVEGEDVLGVSTIAKVGGVDETWGIASAWGFRIGYEGAFEVFADSASVGPAPPATKDDLRAELKTRKLTPWDTRDKAADRGTWVHDVLEELAQENEVPLDLGKYPEVRRGHALSLLRWYLHYRPSFVATEVQVASKVHRFAGRYDLRALIRARLLLPLIDPLREDPAAVRIRELAERDEWALGLLDLKTSKGIYPTTHFPQLEGYEGAGVEMGFPATDFRAVINTNEDGTFYPESGLEENAYGDPVPASMAVSWATYEDFVAYGEALRAIRRIKANDPEVIRDRRAEEAILSNLPARSRDLAELGLPELEGWTPKKIGMRLGKLRKFGRVEQLSRGVWARV